MVQFHAGPEICIPSWVDCNAILVQFLAQGNNNSNIASLGIEPGTLRLPDQCSNHLTAAAASIEQLFSLLYVKVTL